MIQQTTIRLAAACVICALSTSNSAAETDFQVGFGRKKITPTESLWMSGYAGRRQGSTGVLDDLYAQAMAVRDRSGARALLLRIDVCTLAFPILTTLFEASSSVLPAIT